MTPKLPMTREEKRAELAKQMESVPEQAFDPSDDKKRQTLGPTREVRRLVADTPIKFVRKEPVKNLRFRKGYERFESEFRDKAYKELLESIKKDGINTIPIDVREVITPTESYVEVLTGTRRTHALQELGVPNALVAVRECDDKTADHIHELENSHRKAKSFYSRAIQYVGMFDRYSSIEEFSANIQVPANQISEFLNLVKKAPDGLWEKVEDPASLTWGECRSLIKAFDLPQFKHYCASVMKVKSRDLVDTARRFIKKPEAERSLEKEIFAKKRGDRMLVQLPKNVSEVDQRKVVELVLRYFQSK